jgi:TorA maturation chaperone TorD
MEGQCPSAGNGADGCFAIIVNRKDDFDFGPRGFYWSIMDNRIIGKEAPMDTQRHAVLAALGRFFLARTGEEMARAYAGLCRDGDASGRAPDLEEVDWEAVEFAFNKLFVGPMALQASPYASSYLEPEPRLMGESTLTVRRIYEMAGLVSPLRGRLPEDHVGVELDAALAMLNLVERCDAEEPRCLWRYFFHEHLGVWLPMFLDRARNADAGHPVVDLALDRLDAWLEDQRNQQEGDDP